MKQWTQLNQKQLMLSVACSGLAVLAGCCTRSSSQARYYAQPGPAYASTGSSTSTQYPATEQTQTGNFSVPLYEETVNVGKREVDSATVTVRKIIKTETVNQPIELRHEEIVIDRSASGSNSASTPQAFNQQFQEGSATIRLKSEVPVVEKVVQQSGTAVVSTRMTGGTQTNVTAQIRREDIDIVKSTDTSSSAVGSGSEVGGQSTGSSTNTQNQDQSNPPKQNNP